MTPSDIVQAIYDRIDKEIEEVEDIVPVKPIKMVWVRTKQQRPAPVFKAVGPITVAPPPKPIKPFVIQKDIYVKTKTEREVYTVEQLKFHMKKHGLFDKGWSYKFDNARNIAGRCYYQLRTISISRYFVNQLETITEKDITNTILHEIAHAYVGYKHAHNEVWRKKAIEIGCDGNKYCKRITEPGKYKYNFECSKGCKIGRHRKSKLNTEKRICKKHRLALFQV